MKCFEIHASDSITEISIIPGTTARDVIQALGLPDYVILTRGRGAEPFHEDDDLYAVLAEGGIVFATTEIQI